jgi:hypothetical protein
MRELFDKMPLGRVYYVPVTYQEQFVMIQIVKPSTAASFPAGHGVDCSDSSRLPSARRGRLKNGNPSGDFLAAPRCGAHTRCGGSCRQPAMRNGRCRLHGGLSTGPRTAAGLARSCRARWKHGARSAEVTALRRAARAQLRRMRTILAGTRLSAGHGVHRSIARAAARAPIAKANHREHRDRRGAMPPSSCAARHIPSSVSPVVNPFPAGHGVHRSNSQSRPAASVWPSRRDRLRSSASIVGLTYPRPLGMGSFAQS